MTRRTVTYIPREKFLTVRLLAAVFWTSFFACWWLNIFEIGNERRLSSGMIMFLIGAVLFSLITYSMNMSAGKDKDD